MRVEPSQLIPGCILLHEVKGKSNRAIIPKNTALEEKHLIVLDKFLVEFVEVSSKLANGDVFKPNEVQKKDLKRSVKTVVQESKVKRSFSDLYSHALKAYKKEYQQWQNSMPIDIASVRKFIMPLLESVDNLNAADIYTLYKIAEKDDYIYNHSVAVSLISAFVSKKLGYSKGEYLQVGLAGLLSDCGTARIDSDMVFKTASLTPKEWEVVKQHPTYSYRMVENLPSITTSVKLAVLQHHERMDGSGYPFGTSAEKIHPYAKIIAIADSYHAMASERLYQSKQSVFSIIEEIQNGQYTKFDGKVVNCFINSFTNISVGLKVTLSNGKRGEIVFINPDKPTRPMVRIPDSDEIISLEQKPDIFITAIAGR